MLYFLATQPALVHSHSPNKASEVRSDIQGLTVYAMTWVPYHHTRLLQGISCSRCCTCFISNVQALLTVSLCTTISSAYSAKTVKFLKAIIRFSSKIQHNHAHSWVSRIRIWRHLCELCSTLPRQKVGWWDHLYVHTLRYFKERF